MTIGFEEGFRRLCQLFEISPAVIAYRKTGRTLYVAYSSAPEDNAIAKAMADAVTEMMKEQRNAIHAAAWEAAQ